MPFPTKETDTSDFTIEEERSKILQWISSVEYAKHHLTAAEDRVQGTGEWLFRRNDFIEWQNSRDSAILWLHGIRKIPEFCNILNGDILTLSSCFQLVQGKQKSRKNPTHLYTARYVANMVL